MGRGEVISDVGAKRISPILAPNWLLIGPSLSAMRWWCVTQKSLPLAGSVEGGGGDPKDRFSHQAMHVWMGWWCCHLHARTQVSADLHVITDGGRVWMMYGMNEWRHMHGTEVRTARGLHHLPGLLVTYLTVWRSGLELGRLGRPSGAR